MQFILNRLAFFLMIITALGYTALFAQPNESRSPIYVFNDQSHEFTFQYDWWIRSYLPPEKFIVTSNLASLESSRLEGYQVLLIEMHDSGMQFTQDEIGLIDAFLKKGGGLFLVGNGYLWNYNHKNDPYPMNRLSERFGFEFLSQPKAGSFQIADHEITNGITEFQTDGSSKPASIPGLLILHDDEFIPLVSDHEGKPIIACRLYGKGKMVVSSHLNLLSPEHLGIPLRNERLIQNIFHWLSDNTSPFEKSRPDTAKFAVRGGTRIQPENRIEVGKVSYSFAGNLETQAQFIIDKFPIIFAMLDSITGVKPIFDFNIILLAGAGGGYSSGAEIGIGFLAQPDYVLRVIAHELVHSWTNPGAMPQYFNEAWASLLAIRVATKLGYSHAALKERNDFKNAFELADSSHQKLDLNNVPKAVAGIPAYTGKAMWIGEQLEDKYGKDFFRKFFTTKRRRWTQDDPMTMADFIRVLGLSVEDDLYPYFSQIGTTY